MEVLGPIQETRGQGWLNVNPRAELHKLNTEKKSTCSEHDRQDRLSRPSPSRQATTAATVPLCGHVKAMAEPMSMYLDKLVGIRPPILIAGILLASGRRTADRRFKAASVQADWGSFYDLVASIGRSGVSLMPCIAHVTVKLFDAGLVGHWTLAVGDSPTKRYGRYVEAANIQRNPTLGLGDGD